MIFCVVDNSAIRDIEVYTLQQTGFKAKKTLEQGFRWSFRKVTKKL